MPASPALALPLLAPLLYVQGRWVRRVALRLPEAAGPREGTAGRDGRRLRLLLVGDSSAAGVGATTQAEALAGRLVDDLGRDHRVEWRLVARTGATTASTIGRLRREPPDRFDVAVVCLGVNDVTSGVGLARWRDGQERLRALLRERFGVELVVANGLPPMGRFPLLPQPLRWYLGTGARRFTAALESDLEAEARGSFVRLDFTADTALMAPDGFHPGPSVYAEWARRVAAAVRRAHGGDATPA